jgi:hypothetical protein
MAEGTEEDNGKEFKLERYKYILQQIHTLNQNLYRYLSLFQTLATAVVGGGIAIFISHKELKIDAATARVGIHGLLGLLIILATFVVVVMIVGIFSWLDYRQDEVKLLNEAIKPGYRKPPHFRNIWRWHETYFIAFLILMMITITAFVETQVIPLIK